MPLEFVIQNAQSETFFSNGKPSFTLV